MIGTSFTRAHNFTFLFFRALGVNLKQLYGMTEASVYITAQPDGEIYADTVGKPNLDVDVKIDETGEVLFRSPGVFAGYFKEPEKTAEVKTADGFVRTGDAGFIDQPGCAPGWDQLESGAVAGDVNR